MTALTFPDLTAFAWFAAAWIVYSIVIEKTAKGRTSLNALMNRYRDKWMEQPLALTTTGVVIVMWQRQFASDARKAFEAEPAPGRRSNKNLRPSPSRRR